MATYTGVQFFRGHSVESYEADHVQINSVQFRRDEMR